MLHEQEKIDKYLKDEMTLTERQTFEKSLQNDKALADKLALHQDVRQFLKERVFSTAPVSDLEEKPVSSNQNQPVQPMSNSYFYKIIILIIILIGIAVFSYYFKK